MDFSKKIQELRKQNGLTQEQLASQLFVSRTAVSKWESGRGYPNIDSLKSISKLFSISVDELLSGEELLAAAEEDNRNKIKNLYSLVFGLLDISVSLFFLLPLLRQKVYGIIQAVSLLSLTEVKPYLQVSYFILIITITLFGILTLAIQTCKKTFWLMSKSIISLALSILATLLFIISSQPYAAAFLFVSLTIKAFILIKKY